ncbi:MAG: DUF1211 domain-containing protein [Planctomycetes bacterium]|nr:DUF1211 domain-containing protein [Planctomycetota bacterium]
MIREHLFHKKNVSDPLFRWRGGEVSRLEGLSDGVFALALTMLVIRSDVPSTFYELRQTAIELPVFLVCFAMLMMAWRYHYLFFRRYGLEDLPTTLLNSAYLFLVIFLVFPLKFLATFLYAVVRGQPTSPMFADHHDELGELAQRCGMMQFYSVAIIGVFGLQLLMLLLAYARRERLELDRLERFLTIASMTAHGITCGIAGVSLLVVVMWSNPGMAGVTYFLMPVAHGAFGFWTGHRADRLRRELEAG